MADPIEPAAPEKKKSLFDTILTATPVLLTVVSTFMVGRSTAEMTQAQYHRAVASQNQSKVADQWGFFQAKRIRGTSIEVGVDSIDITKKPLPVTMRSLAKEAQEVQKELNKVKVASDEKELEEARELAMQFVEQIVLSMASTPPGELSQTIALLSPEFKFPMPEPNLDGVDKEQAELLKELVNGIRYRKPEHELVRQVDKLKEDTLSKAIIDADRRADQASQDGKKLDRKFDGTDKLVNKLAILTRSLTRGQPERSGLSDAVDWLVTDYKTARADFTARRYENDARSNQDAAYLYEAKVYVAGAKSDRHLERSKKYMYAMLIAQVGVVLASLAMAVRRKSVVWLLAALAGLVAILWGVSVFLGMV